jgi:hypothetical protein
LSGGGESLYAYRAYGITLSSELPLPELEPGDEAASEVTIRFGGESGVRASGTFLVEDGFAFAQWPEVGAFTVLNGQEVVVYPGSGVDPELLRLPLLGPVLGLLLHQRGMLVFHANAVLVDGSAVLFLGAKGHGKSTMAAAFLGRGYRVLADDVVALTPSGDGRFLVQPGLAQLKLWPDAVSAALGSDAAALSRLVPVSEKRRLPVESAFAPDPAPARALYVLGGGPELRLRELRGQEALMALISNLYVPNLLHGRPQTQETVRHLPDCARFLQQVHACLLERPASLDLLPASVELIERDLRAHGVGRPLATEPFGQVLPPLVTAAGAQAWISQP